MAAFTIKNFDDIDNALEGSEGLDMRFGRKHLESEHVGVTRVRYAAGARIPFGHSHREQEEVYVVISGSGRVRLDDELVDVRQWDIVRVAPALMRAFEAGPDGLEVIAIGADRPEGGDATVVKDWWTD